MRQRVSQIVGQRDSKEYASAMVANWDHLRKLKFSPVLPEVFTEHGAIMLACSGFTFSFRTIILKRKLCKELEEAWERR